MDPIVTHQNIRSDLCGTPIEVKTGYSKVELKTTMEMVVDAKGLVHGGFIFGLADYAAMIAVNDPNVVLGASSSTFKKPVKVGDVLMAEAKLAASNNNKRFVDVFVTVDGVEVYRGNFTCFILKKHVLD